jgi:hypothetical protein
MRSVLSSKDKNKNNILIWLLLKKMQMAEKNG